jgi:hypothetical protein
MLEELTSNSVFSEVMMEEPPPRVVLLVEGPDEDAILYEHLSDGVSRIIAGNKKAVLGAAQIALDGGLSHVFGLVDRDLDALRGKDSYPPNVVATDAYDLIADLVGALGDEAVRRALIAHAAASVRVVEAAAARSVVDVVFDLTGPLAAVRLASLKSGYPLILHRYEFRAVLTTDLRAADVSAYVTNAVCKNPDFAIDPSVIDDVRNQLVEVTDRRHSGGHDLVSASVAVIARGGGSVSKKAIAGNIISFATCDVLASIPCLSALDSLAAAQTGQSLFECVAA